MTERERRHFEAIARAKDQERKERLREALARCPLERMVEGLALADVPTTPEAEAALDRRALGQANLARLAAMRAQLGR